tara:strand:- start:164 stop:1294 length:1131 start_codon:yes stop_codon:yes gene_type:complete
MALTKVNNDLQDALAASQPTITSVGTLTGFTSTGIDDNATSTAITIDASENVGIGVSPASGVRLDVRSNAAATLGDFRNASATGFGLYVAAGDTASQYAFRAADYQNNALFSVMGDGNVGVGTGAPARILEVSSGTAALVRISATDTSPGYAATEFRTNGSTYAYVGSEGGTGGQLFVGTTAFATVLGNATALPIQFATNNTVRATIDSSGNVLVGKTAGNSPTVIGFEAQQDGEVYSTIATGYNTYHVYANSGYRFYVNPNGGIYNYSANNVNLSDEREKKNIETLESQWDSLKQWSLKKFHYNADDDSEIKKLGVIAQEVKIHNPEVISEFNVDEDTTRMAVKEQQMMWMAIKALQEAMTRIESLEARIAALEA